MSGFEPIELEYKGTTYTVPPSRCMGLLAQIEEILTPGQGSSALEILAQPQRAHMTKLARAYGATLRYAGCPVSDDDVYIGMMRDISEGGATGFEAIKTLGDALLMMFFSGVIKDDEAGKSQGVKTPSPQKTSSKTELFEASTN